MTNYPNLAQYSWVGLLMCMFWLVIATSLACMSIHNSYRGMDFLVSGVFGRPEQLGGFMREAVTYAVLASIASVITIGAIWIFHIQNDLMERGRTTLTFRRICAVILSLVIIGLAVHATYVYVRLTHYRQIAQTIINSTDGEAAGYKLQQESAEILRMAGTVSASLLVVLAFIGFIMPISCHRSPGGSRESRLMG